MIKVLTIIDMQNDFLTGSLANYKAQEVIDGVINTIKYYAKKCEENGDYLFIVFTQDTHYSNYLDTFEGRRLPVRHCIEGTWGWEINEQIADYVYNLENVASVCSLTKNSFGSKELCNYIDNLKTLDEIDTDTEIIMTGVCTDICVVSNALMLREALGDTNISVVREATAGLTKEKEEAALSTMESCMIDIISLGE